MSDVAGSISIHVGVICLCVPGKLQSQLISEFSHYMHIGPSDMSRVSLLHAAKRDSSMLRKN